MIVIDLGCATHHAPSDSVNYLVERFAPRLLYGFDPLLAEPSRKLVGKTACFLSPNAAWTYSGEIGLERSGTGTRLNDGSDEKVPCFDIAEFVAAQPVDDELVLKMDIEGAEYAVLEHLHERGLDRRLKLVLVEWHHGERVELDCPVEGWVY